MRKLLLTTVLVGVFGTLSAQFSYSGATFDFNSGIGQRFCYGLGFNLEISCGKREHLYLNCHYTVGSTSHLDTYMRANASLLLYTSDDWLKRSNPKNALGALIIPAVLPIGFTYYTKVIRNSGVRVGVYINPATLDFWDQIPAVVSVSTDLGLKAVGQFRGNMCWYISVGGSMTNNIADRRGKPSGYGNEYTFTAQIGLMKAHYK